MEPTAPRYVVIHGHFYQPPRENPWIEAIEKQPSAQPYHDWNERIAWECYIPNKAARVMGDGRILDMVNNYSRMSFNFGPTLLDWMQKNFPKDHDALVEADAESRQRLGRGNALAQAYNHAILPLASPRDRATQIRWGLADFRHRFRRDADSMWLPETAVNAETLRALIDHKLRFVILAPNQADKVRRLGRGGRWHDVSDGTIDTKRAYRWYDKDSHGRAFHDRYIDVFFYDGNLAKSVAFERAMSDSRAFAARLEAAFDPKRRDAQLVHFATDGESYGHHEKYAEMGLAHLLKYELPKRGIEVINYSVFLDRHPPIAEVEIKAGLGTAWSCAHGVARWMEDCGCGSGGGWHQKWRGPLRWAFDWLRDELARIFEAEAHGLLQDPWAARDQYIRVVLDRSDERVDAFMRDHLIGSDTEERRVRALKLLELQRHSMLLYTSCAWFFDELSRVEPVQNLKYAARAIQLARELTGRDLESEFLPKLKDAPSNLPEFGDGWGVYNKLVRPAIVTPDQVVGQYAISLLFGDLPEEHSIYHYHFTRQALVKNQVAGTRLVAGRVTLTSGITHSRFERQFLAIALQDQTLRAYVGEADGDFEPLRKRVLSVIGEDILKGVDSLRQPFFPDHAFSLESLFTDERERIFSLIIQNKLERLEGIYDTLFQEYFPMIEELHRLHLPPPSLLKSEVELALGHWLLSEVQDLAKALDAQRLETAQAVVERAKKSGLIIHTEPAEDSWTGLVFRVLDALERDPSPANAASMAALIKFGLEAGFTEWRYRTENRLFKMLSDSVLRKITADGQVDDDERKAFGYMLDLGERLGISVDEARKKLAAHPSTVLS